MPKRIPLTPPILSEILSTIYIDKKSSIHVNIFSFFKTNIELHFSHSILPSLLQIDFKF